MVSSVSSSAHVFAPQLSKTNRKHNSNNNLLDENSLAQLAGQPNQANINQAFLNGALPSNNDTPSLPNFLGDRFSSDQIDNLQGNDGQLDLSKVLDFFKNILQGALGKSGLLGPHKSRKSRDSQDADGDGLPDNQDPLTRLINELQKFDGNNDNSSSDSTNSGIKSQILDAIKQFTGAENKIKIHLEFAQLSLSQSPDGQQSEAYLQQLTLDFSIGDQGDNPDTANDPNSPAAQVVNDKNQLDPQKLIEFLQKEQDKLLALFHYKDKNKTDFASLLADDNSAVATNTDNNSTDNGGGNNNYAFYKFKFSQSSVDFLA